ncbi:hypothetical protein PAE9249_00370 [Paenibacillus sp. CECT 9249]|nr:hypothetical protein PAE9249_00370 [Paenibacillus sp. CECT 9249]
MNMKGKKKWILGVLSAIVALSLIVGCSGGGGTSQGPAEPTPQTGQEQTNEGQGQQQEEASDLYPLGKEPLEISFYGHYDWYSTPPWGKDEASKWIKENLKVNIKPIQSGNEAEKKLQTMIVAGQLPDIIWTERGADVERLREAGMLVPLDDYMEKYPNLKKWLGEDTLKMLRSEDGKLYQFPNWYTNQPNGNAGYAVNKKIYKELGSPKLETTDDLYNYLKLVKEKYPNVIPFETTTAKEGNGIDQLYSAFKENNRSYTRHFFVPDGDKMTSIFLDEPFREATVYAAKLFREKLMTQDAFTQTEDKITEKVMNGRVAVLASSDPMKFAMPADAELSKKDPDAGYFMIWPIYKEGLDKNKIYPGSYNVLGWNVAVITTSAKDPEAVFAFLDWYTGPEGQTLLMWGPEGRFWDGWEEDGITPKFTEKYVTEKDELAKLQGETTNITWVGNTVYVDNVKTKYESTLDENDRNWATRWQSEVTWKTQSDATEFVNLAPMPESEEGIIYQRVKDIWLKVRSQALTAKTDQEVLDILDKAHADSVKSGYDKLLEYYDKKWKENLKALGR